MKHFSPDVNNSEWKYELNGGLKKFLLFFYVFGNVYVEMSWIRSKCEKMSKKKDGILRILVNVKKHNYVNKAKKSKKVKSKVNGKWVSRVDGW